LVLKKVVILVQGPQHKSTSDSVRAPQKNHFGAILIEFGDTKKCHTFSGLELVPKSLLAVSAACTKVKNAFKSFATIRKIPFVENYKECAMFAILRGKTSFWGHKQRLKNVLCVVRCAKNAAQRLKNNPNPSGLSKKCLLCKKSAILSVRCKIKRLGLSRYN